MSAHHEKQRIQAMILEAMRRGSFPWFENCYRYRFQTRNEKRSLKNLSNIRYQEREDENFEPCYHWPNLTISPQQNRFISLHIKPFRIVLHTKLDLNTDIFNIIWNCISTLRERHLKYCRSLRFATKCKTESRNRERNCSTNCTVLRIMSV